MKKTNLSVPAFITAFALVFACVSLAFAFTGESNSYNIIATTGEAGGNGYIFKSLLLNKINMW